MEAVECGSSELMNKERVDLAHSCRSKRCGSGYVVCASTSTDDFRLSWHLHGRFCCLEKLAARSDFALKSLASMMKVLSKNR